MTANAFQAVLEEPDDDKFNTRLCKLIEGRKFSAKGLSATAEHYLHAFCDENLPSIQRRWVGIALAAMIGASPSVAKHLEGMSDELTKFGDIILSNTELEELKIVSGIIVRQIIERGVDSMSFWASDKVKSSAVKFPERAGPNWINEFQELLDTLADLAFTKLVTDPCIVYPISMTASNGLQCVRSKDRQLVAITQNEIFTIIAPDDSLELVQFVDIPIAHIKRVRAQKSTLHDSQAKTTEDTPWDLILSLDHEGWAYHVNTVPFEATELTVLFQHSRDAKECESSIQEFQRAIKQASVRTESQIVARGRSPTEASQPEPSLTNGTRTRQQRKDQRQSSSSHDENTRLRRGLKLSTRSEPLSSDQLGKTPANGRSSQVGSAATKSSQRSSAVLHERHVTNSRQTLMRTSQRETNVKTDQKHQPTETHGNEHKKQTRSQCQNDRAQEETSVPSDDLRHSTSSATGITELGSNEFKAGKHGNGKLPKISQSTKQAGSTILRESTDVFEVPEILESGSETGNNPGSKVASRTQANKKPSHKNHGVAQQKPARNIKKTDDDDEFLPVFKQAKKPNAKRKSTAAIEKEPRKKIRGDPSTASVKSSTKFGRKSQAPAPPPKASLIGNLVEPRTTKATKIDTETPFKKPSIPVRTAQPPSTPTPRREEVSHRPSTPQNMRQPPSASGKMVSSSPRVHHSESSASGGVNYVYNTILSSNSKPLPASPNADSTAISGLADREEVDLERQQGDIQMAKKNPFKQTPVAQKTTSFTRRLTGENILDDESQTFEATSYNLPHNTNNAVDVDTENHRMDAVSRPLLKTKRAAEWISSSSPKRLIGHPDESPTSIRRREVNATPVKVTEPVHKSTRAFGNDQSVNLQSYRVEVPTPEAGIPDMSRTKQVVDKNQRKLAHLSTSHMQREKSIDVIPKESVQDGPAQTIEDTQVDLPGLAHEVMDLEGDTTLVDHASSDAFPIHAPATPLHFRSSPPPFASPSSHRSTSAEPDEPATESAVPTSEAEETEWEKTLQPHQRELHDAMMRVSRRVLRQIVDNETVLTDIAEQFADDSEVLLTNVLKKHEDEYVELWGDLRGKKKTMRKEMERSARQLQKERERIAAMK